MDKLDLVKATIEVGFWCYLIPYIITIIIYDIAICLPH